jgi:hypothetical protein
MQDRQDIAELERRITGALGRIRHGLARLPVQSAAAAGALTPRTDSLDLARLRDELATTKAANAQLTEKLRGMKDREVLPASHLEDKVEKMTRQLDVQGLELQRMRKTTIQLREHLRLLHEAAAEGVIEPNLINRAMFSELDALRATRHTEIAEMDEILADLAPLIEEARAYG